MAQVEIRITANNERDAIDALKTLAGSLGKLQLEVNEQAPSIFGEQMRKLEEGLPPNERLENQGGENQGGASEPAIDPKLKKTRTRNTKEKPAPPADANAEFAAPPADAEKASPPDEATVFKKASVQDLRNIVVELSGKSDFSTISKVVNAYLAQVEKREIKDLDDAQRGELFTQLNKMRDQ